MAHPQRQLRAFIDDGPRAGQTLSIDPGPGGRAPREIVLADTRPRSAGSDESDGEDAHESTYRLDGEDLENGLYVYRVSAG